MRRALSFLTLALCAVPVAPAAAPEHWVATWGTSQQLYRQAPASRGVQTQAAPAAPRPAAAPPSGPARRFPVPPALAGLHDQTIRMVVRTSIGGRTLRIRLTGALGAPTVAIGAARIALSRTESRIDPATDHLLTFSGQASATLYAGATLVSDPVAFDLKPLADIAVSLYLPGDTGVPTSHLFGLHTTYISKQGDFSARSEIPEPETRESYYWLAGIDVAAPASAGTLVTFGDSITDGDQSTHGTNGSWPSLLAARLQAGKATSGIAVVNAGISGNRVLGDNGSALARLEHDVLSQPGIRWITLLEGINDITGGSRNGARTITAEALIAAYRQIIETAHLHGIQVIGCTLTPYGGSNVYNDFGESVRTAVNAWIRKPGSFDGVIDFDAATRDPKNPARFRPEADSPDLLHPANPGYKLMADAIDLKLFTRTKR